MMKLNYMYIMGLTLLLLFFGSCTDQQEEISGDGGKVEGQRVTLTLTSLPLQSSGKVTRSTNQGMDLILGDEPDAGTRTPVDETPIENLCIFQFEGTLGSSTAKLMSKTYVEDLKNTTLSLTIESFTQCFLFVCANVGDITKDYTEKSSTYQDIQNSSYRIAKQDDLGTALPMSGCSAQLEENVVTGNIAISLTRMVAKVSFTCNIALPAGDSFDITCAKLCNVPQTADYVSPDGNTNAIEVNSHIGINTGSIQATLTYEWYMPENKRGNKEGASSWMWRIAKNAPNYASFIELTGNYTYAMDGSTTTTTTKEVTYVIYLGNGTDYTNYDVERNHHYQITSTIKGINFADQRVSQYTNLSADGLANCYLASKDNHKYCFNGTVRGNGNTEDYAALQYPGEGVSLMPSKVVDSAPDAVTIPIDQVKDAVLMWETGAGVITKVDWDAVSGCVRFETGTTIGNALIAVRNANGTILWSWHIWRTNGVDLKKLDENYKVEMQTYNKRTLYVMDRNLGANFGGGGSSSADAFGANALYYQFGRKDPFPGVYSSSTGIQRQFEAVNAPSSNGLVTSLTQPHLFYKNTVGSCNWIIPADVQSPSWMVSNCLWGDNSQSYDLIGQESWNGEKTIYDPSPAGWRVASADVWTGILKDNSQKLVMGTNYYSSVNIASSYTTGYTVYSNIDSNKHIYLIGAGLYSYTGGPDLNQKTVSIWLSSSCASNSSNSKYSVHCHITNSQTMQLINVNNRAFGYSVRCAKR